MWLYFFFFQAEDGIRDIGVTGVQTCALPISFPPSNWGTASSTVGMQGRVVRCSMVTAIWSLESSALRSEERRVGKECRTWWSGYNYKIYDTYLIQVLYYAG